MENSNPEVSVMESAVQPQQPVLPGTPKAPTKRPMGKIVLLLGLLIAAIVIVVLLVTLTTKSPDNTTTAKKAQENIPTAQIPKFSSTKYEDRSALGKSKNSSLSNATVKRYPLKNNLTGDDIRTIKTKLDLTNATLKKSEGDFDLYTTAEGEKSTFLLINTKIGTFDFYKESGIKMDGVNTPEKTAEKLLQNLGLLDATITCPVTFQKSDAKDVTYVECHRNWNSLGAPLLNPPGILNLPETKFMSTLSPGNADPNGPRDATVINTNNQQDGLLRPVDFNSVVVGIQKDGSIITVSSTMRVFDKTQQITPQKIIGPQEALAKIKNNTADFTIMMPAGTGTVDMKKLYPNNLATSNDAVITDMVLGYIEKPLDDTQDSYEPYYIAKGVATLTSGYTVKFVQAVKATKQSLGFFSNPLIKTAYAQDQGNKNMPGTTSSPSPSSSPSQSPSPSPTSGNNACTPTPTPTECSKESDYAKVVKFDIPGYGTIILGQVSTAPNTYYLISTTGSTNKQDMINAIAKGLCPDLDIPSQIAQCKIRFPKVFQNTNGVQPGYQTGNPTCYITGLSPAIFLYPTQTETVTISTGAKLTYSDPELKNNSIQTVVRPDGTIQSGTTRPYLYYEYDPRTVHFSLPTKGFIVEYDKVLEKVEEIASKLGLSDNETLRLVQDTENTLNTHASYYFVGIASANEIDQYLPLSITPRPDTVTRIHIILAPTTQHQVNAPDIKPVQRKGFTVVELGAFILR